MEKMEELLEGRDICPKEYEDFIYQELKHIKESQHFMFGRRDAL